jgi:hypothetical protein
MHRSKNPSLSDPFIRLLEFEQAHCRDDDRNK